MNALLLAVLATAVPLLDRDAVPQRGADEPPSAAEVERAIRKGTAFLLGAQNRDGSWGSCREAAVGIDEFWSNLETHRSWAVATTGLCCMALAGGEQSDAVRAAYRRGIDYVLANTDLKRPNEWDTDNIWGYVYGLQALVDDLGRIAEQDAQRRAAVRDGVESFVASLRRNQTPSGGWGYYDAFDSVTRPGSWATSFTTAVGLLGLLDARKAGIAIEERMLLEATRAVRRCRLPNGAFAYSADAMPTTGTLEGINQVKGSLGRIQVCNLALLRAGEEIPVEKLKVGVAHFFREHRFLDVARQRPIPHEAYYYNSGYFYFFGHYYAAQVISRLPSEDRRTFWPKLQREVIKTQEADGSMWDFYMNSYGRPYGTAYSLMVLQQSLVDRPASRPAAGGD
ncbi:MAG: hypothetical protein CHACPFDD_02591 [Phycisphaerae bacterium]|nr:hypothetical protein [Phycisphaerae bacterium]